MLRFAALFLFFFFFSSHAIAGPMVGPPGGECDLMAPAGMLSFPPSAMPEIEYKQFSIEGFSLQDVPHRYFHGQPDPSGPNPNTWLKGEVFSAYEACIDGTWISIVRRTYRWDNSRAPLHREKNEESLFIFSAELNPDGKTVDTRAKFSAVIENDFRRNDLGFLLREEIVDNKITVRKHAGVFDTIYEHVTETKANIKGNVDPNSDYFGDQYTSSYSIEWKEENSGTKRGGLMKYGGVFPFGESYYQASASFADLAYNQVSSTSKWSEDLASQVTSFCGLPTTDCFVYDPATTDITDPAYQAKLAAYRKRGQDISTFTEIVRSAGDELLDFILNLGDVVRLRTGMSPSMPPAE